MGLVAISRVKGIRQVGQVGRVEIACSGYGTGAVGAGKDCLLEGVVLPKSVV